MKSLKIKSLRIGMVTVTEVKDRMGRTLLTSGQTITAQNLKTLIRHLSILGLGGRFVS